MQGADVLEDEIAGYVLGIDRAADVQTVQDIVKLQPVDLGDKFGGTVFFRKQRQQNIFLVQIGEGHKSLRHGQSL